MPPPEGLPIHTRLPTLYWLMLGGTGPAPTWPRFDALATARIAATSSSSSSLYDAPRILRDQKRGEALLRKDQQKAEAQFVKATKKKEDDERRKKEEKKKKKKKKQQESVEREGRGGIWGGVFRRRKNEKKDNTREEEVEMKMGGEQDVNNDQVSELGDEGGCEVGDAGREGEVSDEDEDEEAEGDQPDDGAERTARRKTV